MTTQVIGHMRFLFITLERTREDRELFEGIASLGDALRMVILTDHIRSEYLSPGVDAAKGRRLGAVPIFERVREALRNRRGLLAARSDR